MTEIAKRKGGRPKMAFEQDLRLLMTYRAMGFIRPVVAAQTAATYHQLQRVFPTAGPVRLSVKGLMESASLAEMTIFYRMYLLIRRDPHQAIHLKDIFDAHVAKTAVMEAAPGLGKPQLDVNLSFLLLREVRDGGRLCRLYCEECDGAFVQPVEHKRERCPVCRAMKKAAETAAQGRGRQTGRRSR